MMNAWVVVGGQILAAIIAAGGLLGAAWIAKQSIENYQKQKEIDSKNYRQQRDTDRREELRKRQRTEYEQYFRAFWDSNRYVGTPQQPEAKARYETARDNLFLYASDEGVRTVNEFHKYIVDHPKRVQKDKAEVERLYAAMIAALRKDCYETTNLSDEDIKKFLTITLDDTDAERREELIRKAALMLYLLEVVGVTTGSEKDRGRNIEIITYAINVFEGMPSEDAFAFVQEDLEAILHRPVTKEDKAQLMGYEGPDDPRRLADRDRFFEAIQREYGDQEDYLEAPPGD